MEIVSKLFKDSFLLFSYMPLNVASAFDSLQNPFEHLLRKVHLAQLIDYEHH